MEHKFEREIYGHGMDSYIIPTCSCSWKGRAEYAYEDWQYTNLREQEINHLEECRRKENENL